MLTWQPLRGGVQIIFMEKIWNQTVCQSKYYELCSECICLALKIHSAVELRRAVPVTNLRELMEEAPVT